MTGRTIPPIEERDRLLKVVYGHDPEPGRCYVHSDPKKEVRNCKTCRDFCRWRTRMYYRFRTRGLKLVFDDRAADDREPERCARHGDARRHRDSCVVCRNYVNWRERHYGKLRQQGIDRIFTDWDRLLSHVRKLHNAGMLADDIARVAQCGSTTVQHLLTGDINSRRFVIADVARRLLAVPMPERRLALVPATNGHSRRRVDATGTRRRIQALGRAGHTQVVIARRIGWSHRTMASWLTASTVQVDVADAVADVFPTLIARPGGNPTIADKAASKGWIEARYFSATNIDDPDYDPFRTTTATCGLWRRLQALAWMGYGAEEVAVFTGEAEPQIEQWTNRRSAPMYATHLIDAAFEALTGEHGPNAEAALRARENDWDPPLAWYGADIDNPQHKACRDLPRGDRRSQYPLDSQVHWAITGLVPASDLIKEEKVRVVRALINARWSYRRIAAWLRWNETGDLDKGREAVMAFVARELSGAGPGKSGWGRSSRHEVESGLIVIPGRAVVSAAA